MFAQSSCFRLAVGPAWGDGGLYCHRWPVRAVERYTGPWNSKLSNTILVIGMLDGRLFGYH